MSHREPIGQRSVDKKCVPAFLYPNYLCKSSAKTKYMLMNSFMWRQHQRMNERTGRCGVEWRKRNIMQIIIAKKTDVLLKLFFLSFFSLFSWVSVAHRVLLWRSILYSSQSGYKSKNFNILCHGISSSHSLFQCEC